MKNIFIAVLTYKKTLEEVSKFRPEHLDFLETYYKSGKFIVSELSKAYFLSVDGYHHHFGMNQWNGMRKVPKNKNSTGVEEIYATMDKEKFEENFSIKNGNKAVVQLPNGIKLTVFFIKKV